MEFIAIIPSFFIFLYCLYKLVKDDYVFIRKNISLEQLFDIIFGVIWVSIFFARTFAFMFDPPSTNYFSEFFSLRSSGFSLTGAVLGGLLSLYLIGRYRKIPLGRLFDFFTLAFLFALPWGYAFFSLFVKGQAMILSLVNAGIYFVLMFVFIKSLYPRLMSRTLKEGNLSIIFLIFFSVASLGTSIVQQVHSQSPFLSFHNVILFSLFIFSLLLLLKQEGGGSRARKGLSKK